MEKPIFFKKFLLLIGMLATSFIHAETLAPEQITGARTIKTETARILWDKKYPFVDVRGIDDYKVGHIPGAYHLSVKSEQFNVDNLLEIATKDDVIIFYCNGIHCTGSANATKQAIAWGWNNVFYYREGFQHWREIGLAVETLNNN